MGFMLAHRQHQRSAAGAVLNQGIFENNPIRIKTNLQFIFRIGAKLAKDLEPRSADFFIFDGAIGLERSADV